jgi:hypothetical protein
MSGRVSGGPDSRRRRCALIACLAFPCLALVVSGPFAAVAADRSVKASADRLVVSPRPGQRVRVNPFTIRVRARDGLGDLRARLNGRRIGGDFGSARKGVRTLEVSASHGLRHGRNVVRVSVRRRDGTWLKRSVRFVVAHRRPLAGAGRDARVVVRSRFRLRGFVAVAGGANFEAVAGGAKSGAGRRGLAHRWRLIGAPRLSRLGRRGRGSVRVRALSAPSARRPSFKPDVAGRYKFKLTVRDRSGSTSDAVTLLAVPATPLVPIETMAKQGNAPGIRVGDKFYAADVDTPFYTYPWWQVVVLDRATLGFVSNTTYICEPPAPCEGDKLTKDLSGLGDNKLVIAARVPLARLISSDLSYFRSIGSPDLKGQQFGPGKASVIGVPGLPAGQAEIRAITDGRPADGNMNGYLTPDQFFNYAWLPRERVPFDTRAPGTTGTANVVRVGDTAFKAELGGLPGGFHVFVLDGITLALSAGGFFETSSPTDATEEANRMKDFLGTKVGAGDLVFVDAVNQPNEAPLSTSSDPAALRDLASAIASVGGTRHLFNSSGVVANSKYSLVGWGGAGEGNGEETSNVKDPTPGDGRLRGALTRDRQSLFKPTVVSTADQPSDALAQLVLQPAAPWPLDGNAGAQKAIAYIGAQDNRLGANPRTAYWTQPFDQATWDDVADVVRRLNYPGDGKGFSQADFTAAQQELVQEITWVGDVRAYLKNLSSPFADNALSSWANLTTITDKVKGALNPPDERIAMTVLDVVGGVLSIAGIYGGKVVETIAVAYDFSAVYLTQSRGGGDQDTITGNASELAAGLISRLQDGQASFRNLGNILVSDYAKLKTAGTLGGCSSSSANCPAEWQLSQRDQQQASSAAYRAIEAEFDQRLMNLAFPAYLLGPRGVHHLDGGVTTNAREYPCEFPGKPPVPFYPFFDEPDSGQAALLQELPDKYDVLALANLSNLNVVNYAPNHPPTVVLDRMFGAVSTSLDPKAGGLGAYRPDFMRSVVAGDYDHVQKPGFPVNCGLW